MSGEQILLLVTVVIAVIVFAIIQVSKNRLRIKHAVLNRLTISLKAFQSKKHESEQSVTETGPTFLVEEEKSKAALESLQNLVQDRKQLARDTDVSHHLWSLYKDHFRFTSAESLDPHNQDGEWYGVKILHSSTKNFLNIFEFELNRTWYKFIDDEENRNWSDNVKYFSLFLYDDSNRCLIEIPMMVKVIQLLRKYSVLSGGPRAFIPGGWTTDFINAKFVHQSKRNKEIRTQKHQERLREIEDLKDRFGISD